MEYRRLGRSALRVSPICLGTMNFGPLTTEPDAHHIMDHALDHGINFFDTANRYGGDKGAGAKRGDSFSEPRCVSSCAAITLA